jgi:hypothetical protein
MQLVVGVGLQGRWPACSEDEEQDKIGEEQGYEIESDSSHRGFFPCFLGNYEKENNGIDRTVVDWREEEIIHPSAYKVGYLDRIGDKHRPANKVECG